MTKWIGAAIMALSLMFNAAAAIGPTAAAATPPQAVAQAPQALSATDLSARRRYRHHDRYTYRTPYRPYYYDRPYYYAPAPFFPFLGIGYGPWW